MKTKEIYNYRDIIEELSTNHEYDEYKLAEISNKYGQNYKENNVLILGKMHNRSNYKKKKIIPKKYKERITPNRIIKYQDQGNERILQDWNFNYLRLDNFFRCFDYKNTFIYKIEITKDIIYIKCLDKDNDIVVTVNCYEKIMYMFDKIKENEMIIYIEQIQSQVGYDLLDMIQKLIREIEEYLKSYKLNKKISFEFCK
jgi:hypothetical protein